MGPQGDFGQTHFFIVVFFVLHFLSNAWMVSPDGTSFAVIKIQIFEFPAKIVLSAKYYFSAFS